MYKVTENGPEQLGEERELSKEDRDFIREMFKENENFERYEFGYADLFYE